MQRKKKVNSPIKYPGGKYYLATWIVSLMPEHLTYVEPYAGGLAVLLAKDPTNTSEIINDLYSPLVNFWEALARPEIFEKFKRRCESTPFSERLWKRCGAYLEFDGSDAFESAFSFFVDCRMSLAGRMKSFAALTKDRLRRGMNEQVSAWLGSIEGLQEVHERVRRIMMLNDKAINVIRRTDHKKTLFYLDPHYWTDNGPPKGQYRIEMTKADHEELLNEINQCKGR